MIQWCAGAREVGREKIRLIMLALDWPYNNQCRFFVEKDLARAGFQLGIENEFHHPDGVRRKYAHDRPFTSACPSSLSVQRRRYSIANAIAYAGLKSPPSRETIRQTLCPASLIKMLEYPSSLHVLTFQNFFCQRKTPNHSRPMFESPLPEVLRLYSS